MKKLILGVLLCWMCTPVLKCHAQNKGNLSVAFAPGYRHDNLTWSIAGTLDGTNPNIYSELKWMNVKSVALNFEAHYFLTNRLILRAAASKAYIVAGKVSDHDYQQDNRQYVSFSGLFDSDKGSAVDINAAAGYRLLQDKAISLTVYAGYGISRQYLYLRDNKGTYNAQLNSTYNTQWQGPLASVEARIKLSGKLSATTAVTYHQAKYNATGNWNMIDDFEHPVSYRHNANGFGIVPALRIGYQPKETLELYLSGSYYYWETGQGIDVLYLTNGHRPKTRLNGVRLKGYLLSAGVIFNLH